jgi:signal transduction histidine kinase
LQDINFQELINDVIKSQNKLDDAIHIATDVKQSAEFIGDLFRIKVILNNLISNAIKFKNPENVQHKIQIIINSNQKSVYITITDNGIGILQEHLEHIFKMFFRTLNSNEKQGSGIGLYIVKEALEKIGGTIEVASSIETGTSFKIYIPNKGIAK